VLVQDQRQC